MIETVSSILSSTRSQSPTSTSSADMRMTESSSVTGTTSARPLEFSEVLEKVSTDAVNTIRQGEAAGISGIQGKASVQKVVEAIMSAEQSLQTAIAVRDKVVAAYQEVSRMAI